MGANKNIVAHHVTNAVALPAASGTIVGFPTNIWTLDNVSYQFVATTSVNAKGTFDIQVSNSHDQQGAWQNNSVALPQGSAELAGGVQTQAGTWTSILGLITPAPLFTGSVGTGASVYVNLAGIAARFIRFVYTSDPTSPGTGTLDAWVVGKST
jgi:hypothetical protein